MGQKDELDWLSLPLPCPQRKHSALHHLGDVASGLSEFALDRPVAPWPVSHPTARNAIGPLPLRLLVCPVPVGFHSAKPGCVVVDWLGA